MADGDVPSPLGAMSRNWRSALVVNSLHDALEETERQRDELAEILSRQDGPQLFDDDNTDDEDGGRLERPPHGNGIVTRHSHMSDGRPGTRTNQAPPLLRHSLLNTPALRATTSPARRGRSVKNGAKATTPRNSEKSRAPPGKRTRTRPPTSQSFSSSGDKVRGVRSGGQTGQEAAGLGLSAGSVGSIAGELRGGELERVRGRVADLGAAIETSQSKLLQELSQVQEDFFSSFGYTPPVRASAGSSGSGFVFGSSGATPRYPAAGVTAADTSSFDRLGSRQATSRLVASRDRPLHRRDLSRSDFDASSSGRGLPTTGSSTEKGGEDASVRGETAGTTAAATVDGTTYAFPAGSRSSSPKKWRSLSPSISGSMPSRLDWSRAAGRGRRSPVETAGADELRDKLLTELVEKEALTRELEECRRQADERSSAQADTTRELDELREACRAAEAKAAALEGSLSQQRRDAENNSARLIEAAGKERTLQAERDRVVEERDSFRRAATERTLSLWLRERDRTATRVVTAHWRASTVKAERARASAKMLVSWRGRRGLRHWRAKAALSRAIRARSGKGKGELMPILRRRGIRCLRLWALAARKRIRLGRLLRKQTAGELRRAWSRWTERFRAADARAELLEIQLYQSKVQAERKSDRVASIRSRSVERVANRRTLRNAFSTWAMHSRQRSRACETLSRLLHRRRQSMLAASFRKLAAEAARTRLLDRVLIRSKAVREARTLARGWARLTTGVQNFKRQKQVLAVLLVRRPTYRAFERLKQRVASRRLMRSVFFRLCQSTRMRMAHALQHWCSSARASSTAGMALARLARRRDSRTALTALIRWRFAMVQSRFQSSRNQQAEMKLALAEERLRARKAAVFALGGAIKRARYRSLQWGFRTLDHVALLARQESRALVRLCCIHRHHGRVVLSVWLSRWRRRATSRARAAGMLGRLAQLARRQELKRFLHRWDATARRAKAADVSAARVESIIRRVLLARGMRTWHAECCRREMLEVRMRAERCRRLLCARVGAASRRTMLTRCLTEWKGHTVTRRCQLRAARSFLHGRDHRLLRRMFVAWREGRRKRADTARALRRVLHTLRRATLRSGLWRLATAARLKERKEVAAIISRAHLETEQALRDREALNTQLLEAAEAARRLARDRAFEEDSRQAQLRALQRRVIAGSCFAVWKDLACSQQRKKACARRLLRFSRRRSLKRAFSLWGIESKAAALLERIERVITENRRRRLLCSTLRAWHGQSKMRHSATAVLSRASQIVARLEERRRHRAFFVWKAAANLRKTRAAQIAGACAILRSVRARPGRARASEAFALWMRLSSAAAHADRSATAAAAARQRKILRGCFSALARNANARLRGRLALVSLERSMKLRRWARGWAAIAGAAAAAVATTRTQAQLGNAQACVTAGRAAARARAHRTARRLLGVARGRAALEAFVAWRALVRQGRGARLGACALEARSKRRIKRTVLLSWRDKAVRASRLKTQALSRVVEATRGRVKQAFERWRARARVVRAVETASASLGRMVERRYAGRLGTRLALRTWRRNVCGDGECGASDEVDPATGGGRPAAERLEELARLAIEATSAFSEADSVAQVFELVEEFVSQAALGLEGRLLLLSGEPGGRLFCLESDGATPEEDPLEFSFPVGSGLVARCISTGLPCQTGEAESPVSPPSRKRHRNRVLLDGPADLHGIVATADHDKGKRPHSGAGPRPSRAGRRLKASPPGTASTLSPPATWRARSTRPDEGSRLDQGRGRRSRLAFFPAADDDDNSRSPSPSRLSTPSPRRHRSSASLSPHGFQGDRRSPGVKHPPTSVEGEADDGTQQVLCLPVGGGAGGHSMMGVLKAWRQPGRGSDDAGLLGRTRALTVGELASLEVIAGQVAPALRRLEDEEAEREGGKATQDKRTDLVKEEVDRLREVARHLSGSAEGLARQRDDARAALAQAKGILRRMVPALREVRDRQLGFRHYHDLIVNMSKSVLQDDSEDDRGSPPPSTGRGAYAEAFRVGDDIDGRHGSVGCSSTRSPSKACSPRSPSPTALRVPSASAAIPHARAPSRHTGTLPYGNDGVDVADGDAGDSRSARDSAARGAVILTALRETVTGVTQTRDR